MWFIGIYWHKNALSLRISRKVPQLLLLFLKIIGACQSLKNGPGVRICPAGIHGQSWRGVLVGVSVENGVRSLLNHSILTLSGSGRWVWTKKWGLNNPHGLKNETPAATVEAHTGEVGSPGKLSWCRSTDFWQRSMNPRKEFGG